MARTPPLRVLVVDDYFDTRRSLRQLLAIWGYEAREAADGVEALRVAAEFRPDLVVLDLAMPGLDGYEVARRLRQGGVGGVLVALTGYGGQDAAEVEYARAAGFDHFLTKPCEAGRIEALLRSCRARAE